MFIYTGCVENRQDPLRLGRCQVRIVGLHTKDKVELPTEDLPWALPIQPITSAAMNGIGYSPLGPVEGTWVAIIFQDEFQQQPLMLGTIGGIPQKPGTPDDLLVVRKGCEDEIGGDSQTSVTTADGGVVEEARFEEEFQSIEIIENDQEGFKDPNGKYPKYFHEPDTNRLARAELPPTGIPACIEETIVQHKKDTRTESIPIANDGTWDQPEIPYNAMYPYNHVYESESGHITEFDDSVGDERSHRWNKTGTFEEIDKEGNRVTKIVGDDYEIIEKDGHLFVKGAYKVSVEGAHYLKVEDTVDVEIRGVTTINCYNDVEWNIHGKFDLNIEEEFNIHAREINAETYEKGMHFNSADVINTESVMDTNITSNQNLNTTSIMDTNMVVIENENVTVRGNSETNVEGNTTYNTKLLDKRHAQEMKIETYEKGYHIHSFEEMRLTSENNVIDIRALEDNINIDGAEVHINEDLSAEALETELEAIEELEPDDPEETNDSGLEELPDAPDAIVVVTDSFYDPENPEGGDSEGGGDDGDGGGSSVSVSGSVSVGGVTITGSS